MDFDRFTIALLILRDDAPELSSEDEDRLQDLHMAHLAELHEKGVLLAAGPVLGDSDRWLRGVSILNVGIDDTLRLKSADPAVVAGRFRIEAYPWIVPGGAMTFQRARFPHSQAEL